MILKILVVAVIGAATAWGGSPLVRLLFRLADRPERTALTGTFQGGKRLAASCKD